jgi:uncharacterized protein (DUF433 family)
VKKWSASSVFEAGLCPGFGCTGRDQQSPSADFAAKAAVWLLPRKHEIMGAEVAVSGEEKIDWAECPLVEIKPGVQSGAPVLRGTRMPVSAIIDNFDYGLSVAEIAEQFEVPTERIEAIVTYAKTHRVAHPVR